MAIAAAGALQYAWNLRDSAGSIRCRRERLLEALRHFWFDVTKADWRDTMVGQVPGVMATDRLRMYVFDLHQQFGWPGLVSPRSASPQLARAGRRAALLLATFAVTLLFALDLQRRRHARLPAAVAPDRGARDCRRHCRPPPTAAGLAHRHGRSVVYALTAALIASRLWSDYPALDRSGDRRPEEALAQLTAGLDDRHAVLLADVNWQLQNGLTYFTTRIRPASPWRGCPT